MEADEIISRLAGWTDQIATSIATPVLVDQIGGGKVYRYEERGLKQAIVLKIVRQVSLLRGARILCSAGQVYEQAILQRAMDESFEDVNFLCGPLLGHENTQRHTQYLEIFFQEEFSDSVNPVRSQIPRATVSVDKIRAYNARSYHAQDPSTVTDVTRAMHSAYSGFVHGHSVHILDMYGGGAAAISFYWLSQYSPP